MSEQGITGGALGFQPNEAGPIPAARSKDCVALDAHPRRCFMCGKVITLCNGFVLARDMMHIMQAVLDCRPLPLIKVRELCGKCIFVWDRIAEQCEQI